jgi:excinuclease UvrABC ATPase subunit
MAHTCPVCGGWNLRKEALQVRVRRLRVNHNYNHDLRTWKHYRDTQYK